MDKIKENLIHYIFEEYLEIYEKAGYDVSSTLLDYMKMVSDFYKNPVYDLILNSFRVNYSLFSPLLIKKNKEKILFHKTSYYDSIINNASSKNAIVINIRPNILKNFLFRRTLCYPLFKNFYQDLYSGIINFG